MRAIFVLIALCATMNNASAVSPVIWQQNTSEAFAGGDAVSVSITRDGEVRLGPALEPYADTGEDFVWSVAASGGTVYAGTGGEGRVYRLTSGSSELMFDSPERAIFALHVGRNGTVYAGSSPGGLIYAIPGKGEPKTFARTEDQHVWVLIGDGQGGMYAATGGNTGRVLRVSSGGEVSEVLKTSDPNVTSLVRAADGTLYAGTDQNGLIYRVSASGKIDVLYDAPEDEIKTLAVMGDGSLLAGAMKSAGASGRPANNGGQGRNGGGKKSGGAVVYSIKASGSGWRLWDVPDPSVHTISVRSDGSATVVTGPKGNIYRLYHDGSVSHLTTMTDAQPWTFASDVKGGGWIGASGSGQVYRLGSALSRDGTLTSKPEDFSLTTRWGRIGWTGDSAGGSVSFEVRSGNSEVPDDTWSAWTASTGAIGVREGRYIQYRMTLKGDGSASPVVREVMVSGLPENVRPLLLDLSIRGPMDKDENGGQGGNGGGRRPGPPPESNGGWTVSWTGADVNNDDLLYTVHFKGRAEKTWKLLAEDLTENQYVWDTEAAPEGDVLVRVTVTDAKSNPAKQALTGTRISAPFRIDHTEPTVTISSVDQASGSLSVKGTITDGTSFIRSASYSINSGDWQVVFPADLVFDSKEESLDLTIDGVPSGEATIVIRATDSLGNVGVAKRVYEVK